MSKPYAVFGGDIYYPLGGWEDFLGWESDPIVAIHRAIAFMTEGKWAQVVAFGLTDKIIWEDRRPWM